MKIYGVLLATLVATAAATDFTCAKTEVALCCKKQTDDPSTCRSLSPRVRYKTDGEQVPLLKMRAMTTMTLTTLIITAAVENLPSAAM